MASVRVVGLYRRPPTPVDKEVLLFFWTTYENPVVCNGCSSTVFATSFLRWRICRLETWIFVAIGS